MPIQSMAATGEGNMTLQQSSASLNSAVAVQDLSTTTKQQADLMSTLKSLLSFLDFQSGQGEGKDRIKLLGLPNIGNTCFLNATLQCLFALPEFSTNILRQEEILGPASSSVLLRCFHELQAARNYTSTGRKTSKNLKKKILYRVKNCLAQYNDSYLENYEQDAHELLIFVLCQLKAEGESLRHYIYPVASLEFNMQIERTCCRCGEKVYREEPFNFLSLELTPCLKKSLCLYFKAADVECRCELCLGEQASVVSKLLSLPRVLVLHVKRFSFEDGKLVKRTEDMAIPGIIPLSCISVCGDETSKPDCHQMNSSTTDTQTAAALSSSTDGQPRRHWSLPPVWDHLSCGRQHELRALVEDMPIQSMAATGEGNMTLQQSSASLNSAVAVQDLSTTTKQQADLMSTLKSLLSFLDFQSGQGEGKDRIKLLGLPNIGNTCFLNATLQCLFALPEFSTNILRQEEILGPASSSVLLRCFHELQAARNYTSTGRKTSKNLKKKILYRVKNCLAQYNDSYLENYEQDAHELLIFVLCQLKAEGESLRHYIYPVASLEFNMQIERTCCRCGEKVYREEPFNFLSLELTPCLKKSLCLYFKAADVECRCELCLGEQASVVSKLLSLPRVLVLHVKRFSFEDGKLVKRTEDMAIPGIIPLSCISVCGDETSKPDCHQMNSSTTDTQTAAALSSSTDGQPRRHWSLPPVWDHLSCGRQHELR
ncbi:ubiquitin carboxyl-terminal hydrolase 37-like isoform X2 [Hypomesus transpacificus]|nr:ubiquitin carboxyl-terminal hydrolase 37-like isoform X2 [Hypomesus transpacificus]